MPEYFWERISKLLDVLLPLGIITAVISGIVFVFLIIAIAIHFKHVITIMHEQKKEHKEFKAYEKEILAKIRKKD